MTQEVAWSQVPRPLRLTVCDYVIVEEGTRKVSLLGSIARFRGIRFPAVVPSFSLCAVLTDGMGSGTAEVLLTRMDTHASVYIYRESVYLPNRLAQVSFHARFNQFSFPAPGKYQFTLLVDGESVAQCT